MIAIAQEYSRYPGGRRIAEGPHSGEDFREHYLKPLWEKHDGIVIQLDGTRGYGSSFLEEAFGGMVRCGLITSDEDLQKIQLHSEDDFLKQEITEYIQDALRNTNKHN